MSGGAPAAPGARCLNCGTPLAGRFCSECGQPADVHVPTTHELVHEFLEGMTHSDSRLWRTLKALWLRPGQLTREYVRGARMAYLPPFRLYLVISVVFFVIAASTDAPLKVVTFSDDADQAGTAHARFLQESDCQDLGPFRDRFPDFSARLAAGCIKSVHDEGHSIRHVGFTILPKAMFVFVPLIALLNLLMYWWPRERYAVHWVFFLHLHAFFFSVMTLVFLVATAAFHWPVLQPVASVALPVLQAGLLVYALIALKRVFARGWPLTLLKGFVLFLEYSILIAFTITGVFIYAALQL